MAGVDDLELLERKWFAFLLLSVTAGVMLWLTWVKWPDALIDFGRELYIPWRLSEGEVLYRDLAHFNGPLSPYLNSVWFRLFGVSLLTLAMCNLAIAGIILYVLHLILRQISDLFAATLGCLAFLTLFCFGHLIDIGNYNYLCPYSHELTHGMALALASVLMLWKYEQMRRLPWLMGSGVATGLTFLTKTEVFTAVALSAVAGLALLIRRDQAPRKHGLAVAGVWLVSAMAPVAGAFLLLITAMPASQAMHGLLGSWKAILQSGVTALPFYRESLGVDAPLGSLARMLLVSAIYVSILGVVTFLALRRIRGWWIYPLPALAVGLSISLDYAGFARPFPLFMVLLIAFELRRGIREVCLLRLMFLVLSLGFMAKILLYARIWHYGFVLAMPGTLALVAAIASWLPRVVSRLGGDGTYLRRVVLVAWIIVMQLHVVGSVYRWQQVQSPISTGADRFLVDGRHPVISQALSDVSARLGPFQTLVVIPEGGMINYLSRRVNPTPYISYMPAEMLIFGEDRVLDSLKKKAPDYIALVDRDLSVYGVLHFEQAYGAIHAWIDAHYREVALYGSPPFGGQGFGIRLLQRR